MTADFFYDSKHRLVFEHITRYMRDYGAVPTLKVARADNPGYKWPKVDEPYDMLVARIQKSRAMGQIEEGLAEVVDAFDAGNLEEVTRIMSSTLTSIQTTSVTTRDIDITVDARERMETYNAYEDKGHDLLGIPTGFPTIDRATGGLQPEQLLVFVGSPKAGKTTLELLINMAAQDYGKSSLFLGFEMSNQEQIERNDAIRARIDRNKMITGRLTREEKDRLELALRGQELKPSMVFSSDSASATTLTGMAAKIERYEPDVVFVDGVYMMLDEETGERNTPQALTNLTRGMKRMAQRYRLPVAISTQALLWKMDRKKGLTAGSIGYSSSFAQDADTILGVESTDDELVKKLKVVLARNCPPMDVLLRWDWSNGLFEEMDGQDDDGSTYGAV